MIRNGMKKFKIITLIIIFLIAFSSAISAETTASKIIKSFISEDASYNGFALSINDCVKPKDIKNSFTFGDKQVTWSAVIRGGLGSHNVSDYVVCWYGPDGLAFEKQKPKMLFMDCLALKSSLVIDETTMKPKIGLWKAEVIYQDFIIDNKYFYLNESDIKKGVSQEDIDLLESKIKRDENISKTREESDNKKAAIVEKSANEKAARLNEEIKTKNMELIQKIISDLIDTEKAKVLIGSYFKTSDKDIEAAMDSNGITHIAYGSEKIYWRGRFPNFFGVGNPKVQIYWLTPQKDIFSTNSTTFLPTNRVLFYIKGAGIKEDMLGEWQIVVYVDKAKIYEQKFILEEAEKVQRIIAQMEEIEKEAKQKKEADRIATQQINKEKMKGSGEVKFSYQIKKGYTKEDVKKRWGEPDTIVNISPNKELWLYWEEQSGNDIASTSYAIRGNLFGALFTAVVDSAIEHALAIGHVFGVYFVDGSVKEIRVKTSVKKNILNALSADDFQTKFLGAPLEGKLK